MPRRTDRTFEVEDCQRIDRYLVDNVFLLRLSDSEKMVNGKMVCS